MGQVEFLSPKGYISLHYNTLHYIILHHITLHYITLHHISYLNIVLYCCLGGALNLIYTLQDSIIMELIQCYFFYRHRTEISLSPM